MKLPTLQTSKKSDAITFDPTRQASKDMIEGLDLGFWKKINMEMKKEGKSNLSRSQFFHLIFLITK